MLRPIADVARELGLSDPEWEPRGRDMAKLDRRLAQRPPRGRLVLVTAATPTAHGEGKTLTTIGLAEAMRRLGVRALPAIREPSLGPVFGAKGGATGGGRATVEPRVDINLHFTGDKHAVTTAQDLLAALVDAHVYHGNRLGIDPARVALPRTEDMNDRALRASGFVITAATECMGILCLARDLDDLKARLGRIVVAWTKDGTPVTVAQLGGAGAAAALLAQATRPNLVQTSEGGPALVHAGPFANVGVGTSSVAAARAGLALSDVVVTECGFGADLGAEKFVDIVARQSGLAPACAVVVTTARALAEHGMENLDWNVRLVQKLGLRPIVAVNRFATDTDAQVDAILARAAALDVPAAAHTCFANGGAGGEALARIVLDEIRKPSTPRPLYPLDLAPRAKLETIAREAYGADGVVLEPAAQQALATFEASGYGDLPVCVAKTPLSLSDDPAKLGVPKGWKLRVKDARLHAGAGYIVALCGGIILMPGLGPEPGALRIDVQPDGTITGL